MIELNPLNSEIQFQTFLTDLKLFFLDSLDSLVFGDIFFFWFSIEFFDPFFSLEWSLSLYFSFLTNKRPSISPREWRRKMEFFIFGPFDFFHTDFYFSFVDSTESNHWLIWFGSQKKKKSIWLQKWLNYCQKKKIVLFALLEVLISFVKSLGFKENFHNLILLVSHRSLR